MGILPDNENIMYGTTWTSGAVDEDLKSQGQKETEN